MVCVTRLNGKEFYINPDLIEFVEETPDTVLTMTTGKKVVVAENVQELIGRVIAYKKEIFLGLPKTVTAKDFENNEAPAS